MMLPESDPNYILQDRAIKFIEYKSKRKLIHIPVNKFDFLGCIKVDYKLHPTSTIQFFFFTDKNRITFEIDPEAFKEQIMFRNNLMSRHTMWLTPIGMWVEPGDIYVDTLVEGKYHYSKADCRKV